MAATPPPLPPRPNARSPTISSVDEADAPETEMSEQQLRELYDTEEIDRFMSLFSAYVTEVQLPADPPTAPNSPIPGASSATLVDTISSTRDFAEDTPRPSSPSSPGSPPASSISELIATKYIVPALPRTARSPPLFTLGRLRLTTQRIYLAISPTYGPFFSSLSDLATWKDKRRSSKYCLAFWVLWYYNLLLPYLFLRILYSLIRRRIFPYPTLADLRAHRQEIDRSDEFGRELSVRFSASSSLGIKEVWRLFKVFNKPKKAKAKKVVQNSASQESLLDQDVEPDITTVLDSEESKDIAQENDIKRTLLQVLAELADLHERVKNIFIWRRPGSSRLYGMILLLLFFVTLLIPAKYLAKITYFVLGFLYWHVTPVIASLSSSDRARLPPAFSDVPTDAEYAMELISRRVAAGLDVRPSRPSKQREKKARDGVTAEETNLEQPEVQKKDRDINWKKWGERAALGKSVVDSLTGQSSQNTGQLSDFKPYSASEAHTFPAQHTSAPGLITLTKDKLFFTSLMSSTAKLQVPLDSLRGVKKKQNGPLNGLNITWVTEEGETKVDKFRWVGEREELFARLVGTVDAKRWITT